MSEFEVISYGPDPQQFGHLRVPPGAGPHPFAVVVHGGFWRAAYSLEHMTPLCEALTAAGMATWNLEYRRIGSGGGWPVTFQDVALGARHMKIAARHIKTKGIAIGFSAGGHLALLLGHHKLVSGVVSLAGVADLQRASELGLSRGVADEFLAGASFAQASPKALLPAGVPLRLIHGLDDDVVPHEISAGYAEAARLAGDDVELISLPDTGHSELIDPHAAQWAEVYRQIERISAIV